MHVFIELRNNVSGVLAWRVILDDNDATVEAISEKVRELTWAGMCVGDTIAVYESEMTAAELKLPR